MFKFLEEKREAFCNGIDEDTLPLTFREAISITRKLGVRYLWIDALCIIQDSVADWLTESSQMRNVYHRTYLNLAASASTDGSGGLKRKKYSVFSQRDALYHVNQGVWFLEYFMYDMAWCEGEFESSPLHTRAWVLQELYLAPRTLHYASSQLFWQCMHTFASERYANTHATPEEVPIRMVYTAIDDDVYGDGNINDPVRLCEEWGDIVEQYTSCDLTYSKDRPAAIVGVAQDFCSRFRECGMAITYLAGLWDYHILYDLLWYIDAPQSLRCPRPQDYRAPSWSWLSVDGKIKLASDSSGDRYSWDEDGRVLEGCRVLQTAILPLDRESETSPIEGGYIVLRAPSSWILISNEARDQPDPQSVSLHP